MSDTVSKSISLCGLNFTTQVPATATRYDELTSPGACVISAVQSDIYRGYATALRNALVKLIGDKNPESPRKEVSKTAAGKAVLETPDDYIKRLLAEGVLDAASAQGYADTVEKALPFVTWLASAGGGGGGRIGQEWLDAAEVIMGKWAAGTSTSEKFLAGVQSLVPTATLSDEPTQEEVAALVRRWSAAQRASVLG